MKFIVSSTLLLSHLQTISRVINSKNSMAILDNFLFRLEGTRLSMTASDQEPRERVFLLSMRKYCSNR